MKILIFILMLSLFGASCESQPKTWKIPDVNTIAKQSLSIEDLQMDELREEENCILRKSISLYLDELNDWKTIVVDSLLLRKYYIQDIAFDFSIVLSSDSCYFLALPELHPFLRGKHHIMKNGSLVLEEVEWAALEIKNASLEVLYRKEITKVGLTPEEQKTRALHFFYEAFSHLLNSEVHVSQILAKINTGPAPYTKQVLKVVGAQLNHLPSISPVLHEVRAFEFGPFGYIILELIYDEHQKQVRQKIFFISNYKGHALMLEPDYKVRFKDCLIQTTN